MALSEASVDRIQSSFELLAPKGNALVDRFYAKLFETAPAVRALFPADMTEQKKKLLQTLGVAVGALRKPEELTPTLRQLGARHVGYGAEDAHYPVVRDTLLDTMAELAGDAFTSELRADWTAALNFVAEEMIAGAEDARRKAA